MILKSKELLQSGSQQNYKGSYRQVINSFKSSKPTNLGKTIQSLLPNGLPQNMVVIYFMGVEVENNEMCFNYDNIISTRQ